MNRFEKQARIDYLWSKVRVAVSTGWFVQCVIEEMKVRQIEEMGLTSESPLSDDKILEENLD